MVFFLFLAFNYSDPVTFLLFYFSFFFSEPNFIGASQCLGELYKYFGRRITSGLLETTIIATKLMKFNEVFPYNFYVHMFKLLLTE